MSLAANRSVTGRTRSISGRVLPLLGGYWRKPRKSLLPNTMPSRSLATWHGPAAVALDEIESAHRAVGGTGRGRRYATQQINQAYAVMLSSQFQRFCRDLQSEAVDELAATVASPAVRLIFRSQLSTGRKLDSGNPNPGNIGSDFGRLGMDFWPEVFAGILGTAPW